MARHARAEWDVRSAFDLLEAQYCRHQMWASCAYFWEDLDRLEPAYAIANAARAIALIDPARSLNLERDFCAALAQMHSRITGRAGADLYWDALPCGSRMHPGVRHGAWPVPFQAAELHGYTQLQVPR